MTDNDRDLFRKLYNLFAAAASNANHTEARKMEFCFRHRSNFMEALTQASVHATRGLAYDSATRLTADEVAELTTRLDYSDFASSCQFAAVQGWVSVDRG
jgi:hypothetical protein